MSRALTVLAQSQSAFFSSLNVARASELLATTATFQCYLCGEMAEDNNFCIMLIFYPKAGVENKLHYVSMPLLQTEKGISTNDFLILTVVSW